MEGQLFLCVCLVITKECYRSAPTINFPPFKGHMWKRNRTAVTRLLLSRKQTQEIGTWGRNTVVISGISKTWKRTPSGIILTLHGTPKTIREADERILGFR